MQDSRLVIFAHGSPDIRWRLPFEELTASLIERHGAEKVRLAYMEFGRPSLADVVREAARDGKLHLRVLPFLGHWCSRCRRYSAADRRRSEVFSASQDRTLAANW